MEFLKRIYSERTCTKCEGTGVEGFYTLLSPCCGYEVYSALGESDCLKCGKGYYTVWEEQV